MSFPPRLLAILGVTLFLVPLGAAAQQGGAADDPVVARVNGDEIHRSDVMELARSLPPQYQAQLGRLFPRLVQRAIDFKLVGAAGKAAGLADDAEFKARLAKAEVALIREIYFERQIQARVTEEALRKRYDEFLATTPPAREHHARHILLKSEAAAREIIAKLDAGADFAELAKEHSTGPSASQGGDLGYFAPGQMVPEFAEATAALEPGSYSKEPTKTQFGWHVIKLEDRRDTAPPSFAEREEQLRQELSRAAAEAMLKELRSQATVEVLAPGAPTAEQ